MVWNNDVLLRAGVPSIFTLLHQFCLHWLGHIHRMEDGHIPKDLLYGELTTGARCRGHPQLHFKDICKHDMKACNIDTESREAFADERTHGSSKCHEDWKEGRLASKKKFMKDRLGEQPVICRTTNTHIRHLSLHDRVATEIANPGLASIATQDDAHQQPLMVLLHSWLTDGCHDYSKFPWVQKLSAISIKDMNFALTFCFQHFVLQRKSSVKITHNSSPSSTKNFHPVGFTLMMNSPHYPRGHGFIERQVDTIKSCSADARRKVLVARWHLCELRTIPLDSKVPAAGAIYFLLCLVSEWLSRLLWFAVCKILDNFHTVCPEILGLKLWKLI